MNKYSVVLTIYVLFIKLLSKLWMNISIYYVFMYFKMINFIIINVSFITLLSTLWKYIHTYYYYLFIDVMIKNILYWKSFITWIIMVLF
jgi:hypothetical protein